MPEIQDILQQCREKIHTWGKAKRVTFPPSTDHLAVSHPAEYHGPYFRILGLITDTDLAMDSTIDSV